MLSPKDITIEDRNVLQDYFVERAKAQLITLLRYSCGRASGKIQYDIVDGCLVLFFHGRHHGVRRLSSGEREPPGGGRKVL